MAGPIRIGLLFLAVIVIVIVNSREVSCVPVEPVNPDGSNSSVTSEPVSWETGATTTSASSQTSDNSVDDVAAPSTRQPEATSSPATEDDGNDGADDEDPSAGSLSTHPSSSSPTTMTTEVGPRSDDDDDDGAEQSGAASTTSAPPSTDPVSSDDSDNDGGDAAASSSSERGTSWSDLFEEVMRNPYHWPRRDLRTNNNVFNVPKNKKKESPCPDRQYLDYRGECVSSYFHGSFFVVPPLP